MRPTSAERLSTEHTLSSSPVSTDSDVAKRGRMDFSKPPPPATILAKPGAQIKGKRPLRTARCETKAQKSAVKEPKDSSPKNKPAAPEPTPPLSATLSMEAWQKQMEARMKTFCTKRAVDGKPFRDNSRSKNPHPSFFQKSQRCLRKAYTSSTAGWKRNMKPCGRSSKEGSSCA